MKWSFTEFVIKALATACIAMISWWAVYAQGRIDALQAKEAVHDVRLEVQQTHFEYIKAALERIEARDARQNPKGGTQ